MTKKLSQTEKIKQHLLKQGINYPADKVVAELAEQGVVIATQLVYKVRGIMKKTDKPVQPVAKQVEVVVETSLKLDTANLGDLLAVQRLMQKIGGADKLQQHVKLLEDLEKKPATELLETFARLTTVSVS